VSRRRKAVAAPSIHLVKLHLVGDIGDALLGRNYGLVTGHYSHSAELQALGEVHGAESDPSGLSLASAAQFGGLDTGLRNSGAGTRQFVVRKPSCLIS
jgi:hypothetical protein